MRRGGKRAEDEEREERERTRRGGKRVEDEVMRRGRERI